MAKSQLDLELKLMWKLELELKSVNLAMGGGI